MVQQLEFCKTCAIFNTYEAFTTEFVQASYTYIGQTIVALAFTFALALGILIYAGSKVFPHNNTEIPLADLIPKILTIIIVSALLSEGGFAWPIYEAMMEWSTNVAIGLVDLGSGGNAT